MRRPWLLPVRGLVDRRALARPEKTLAYRPRRGVAHLSTVVETSTKVIDKAIRRRYVLFEIRDEGKDVPAPARGDDGGADASEPTCIPVLQIEDRPDWMEVAMLQRLERKLRAELGTPSRASGSG